MELALKISSTHHTDITTHETTTVGPTSKPDGLSRGAVAGIVVGTLLGVAIITAAVVYVVKQKKSPEARRLNV